MRILYVTCCLNGLIGLRYLADRGVEIAGVVTIAPETAQRHQVSGYVDVRPFCASRKLRVVTLATYQMARRDVAELDYQAVVVNGWNRLLPEEVIASASAGAIGIHAGHPPIGLGRAPLVWNILLGRQDMEVYTFRLTPRADDGHLMSLSPVEITSQDDVQLLYEKVAHVGARLIHEAIGKLASGFEGMPQNMAFAKHYLKRTPEDGLVDFTASDQDIYNFVRAQSSPYPGAFAFLDGRKWRFDRVVPFDRFAFREARRDPGRIVAALPSGLVVMTGGAPIWILSAECEDGRRIPDPDPEFDALIGQSFVGRTVGAPH